MHGVLNHDSGQLKKLTGCGSSLNIDLNNETAYNVHGFVIYNALNNVDTMQMDIRRHTTYCMYRIR